jgi:hypothetical protein
MLSISGPGNCASKIESGHFPMVVESEIHFRSPELGYLSCHKYMTVGNWCINIYFINRKNPHDHLIWAFLSQTMEKYPGFLIYKAMLAICHPSPPTKIKTLHNIYRCYS